jgi:chorismate-pyruvate lyase
VHFGQMAQRNTFHLEENSPQRNPSPGKFLSHYRVTLNTQSMNQDIIDRLMGLAGSTTLFLEDLRGATLRVSIEDQWEQEEGDRAFITRTTRLFFHSPESPALFCKSLLNKNELTADEYRSLTQTTTPIGKIFLTFNEARDIEKKNVTIAMGSDGPIAACLNVRDRLLYRKEYDYIVARRSIGRIIEFFNEESLQR